MSMIYESFFLLPGKAWSARITRVPRKTRTKGNLSHVKNVLAGTVSCGTPHTPNPLIRSPPLRAFCATVEQYVHCDLVVPRRPVVLI